MSIDWSKPVQTKDGRPVEIKFTDGRGACPVHGYISNNDYLTKWNTQGYHENGNSNAHLQNAPEEREMWLNIYGDNHLMGFHRKEVANDHSQNRIACVHVKYKVGEGL